MEFSTVKDWQTNTHKDVQSLDVLYPVATGDNEYFLLHIFLNKHVLSSSYCKEHLLLYITVYNMYVLTYTCSQKHNN